MEPVLSLDLQKQFSSGMSTYFSKWQQPFLEQQKWENECWNYFMINFHKSYATRLINSKPLTLFRSNSGLSMYCQLCSEAQWNCFVRAVWWHLRKPQIHDFLTPFEKLALPTYK